VLCAVCCVLCTGGIVLEGRDNTRPFVPARQVVAQLEHPPLKIAGSGDGDGDGDGC
jgi:hypothetical protein